MPLRSFQALVLVSICIHVAAQDPAVGHGRSCRASVHAASAAVNQRRSIVREWCRHDQLRVRHSFTECTAETGAKIECNERFGMQGPYEWLTPETNLMKGYTSVGNQVRLQEAMHRAIHGGKNLTVGFLGGSVTLGNYPFVPKREDNDKFTRNWPDWTMHVLQSFLRLPGDAVPSVNARPASYIKKANGAISATKSYFFSLCHNKRLPPNVDVVFLEFAINDGNTAKNHRSFERLVRTILRYPNSPAVVIMNYVNPFARCKGPDMDYEGLFQRGHLLDLEYSEVGRYYDIPVISTRTCCTDLMVQGAPGFRIDRPIILSPACHREQIEKGREMRDPSLASVLFANDDVHPGGQTGARVMGEMAAALMLDAAVTVLGAPPLSRHEHAAEVKLPSPMYSKNYEPQSLNLCFLWDDVKAATTRSDGWVWTDEERGKWGWVSETPGSILEVKIPATRPQGAKREGEVLVGVNINYLQSYEGHGIAAVTCTSGCSCNRTEINSLNVDTHNSQTESCTILVTESPECVIRLEVLSDTKSANGGHKFKLSGFVVLPTDDGPPPEDKMQLDDSFFRAHEVQVH